MFKLNVTDNVYAENSASSLVSSIVKSLKMVYL
jgi:hypothetical protein